MERIELIRDEMGNYCEREMVYAPLAWQVQGLQQTATGYGRKLNTGYKVMYAGKLRRVYAICISNVSSLYVQAFGANRFI